MIKQTMATTIEDRVYDLEREVNKMRDLIWILESTVEDLTLAQRKNEVGKDGSSDIQLKINIDTTEAISQLQRIQKALMTDEQCRKIQKEQGETR
jgi:hypothetical protein